MTPKSALGLGSLDRLAVAHEGYEGVSVLPYPCTVVIVEVVWWSYCEHPALGESDIKPSMLETPEGLEGWERDAQPSLEHHHRLLGYVQGCDCHSCTSWGEEPYDINESNDIILRPRVFLDT